METRRLQETVFTPSRYGISNPLMSWLDDYMLWAKYPMCCGVKRGDNRTFCDAMGEDNCDLCLSQQQDRLTEQQFNTFLPNFLTRVPCQECPYG